ncbi:hypothetical protein EVAR_45607_1 [Eumeta japonica]|uniref:Uncharacterized protein n=1 Tax=Eumeta variegata TaxID=151549 RepID=A0A4C1WEN2_EUMVA|nr:hypothetical protein EVAR_45607_1 [Eumeta japonica]
MWQRVAMCKLLCDSLLTRFDGAVYYSIHFDYYSVATRRHGKRRHANDSAYPAPIDVSRLYIYPSIAWRPVATASLATPTIRFGLHL